MGESEPNFAAYTERIGKLDSGCESLSNSAVNTIFVLPYQERRGWQFLAIQRDEPDLKIPVGGGSAN